MSVITREENMVTIAPGRDIVSSMVAEFKQELAVILAENPPQLRLDMAGVEMVDSMGIGVVIATHNTMKRQGGKLLVVQVAENILKLFKTMRLDQHLHIQ